MKHQNVKDLVLKLRQQFNEFQVNIPDELKAIRAWLVWETTEIQPNGKFDKIPVYPTTGRYREGKQGLPEDLANLGTWADAVAAMENPKYAGVGFACLPCYGIVALDLDHCIKDDVRDPKWDWVLEATYCEVSPSGSGLRAFWTGVARQGKNHKEGVELFHSNGFVTVTGDYYDGGVVSPLSDSLRTRLEQLSQPLGSTQSEGMVLSKAQFQGGDRLALNAEHDQRLSAIKQAGLYERDMGGGKHSIRCPFEEDHSDWGRSGGDGDTVYFQPYTNGYSEGWINCYHTHGNDQAAYWQKIGYIPMNVGVVTDPNFWEEPMPLPNELPPVMAFDKDLLPDAFRPWVADIAYRMQVPIDFSAVGAMVAVSSLIGARVVIAPHRKDSFKVVPNLWGYIVGRPGSKKSPALSEVLQPLNKLEAIERERFKQEETAWGIDLELKNLQDTAKKKEIAKKIANDTEGARRLLEASLSPEKPSRRRFIVNDASVEALQDILTHNQWGLLVYRDEIHSLLTSMDKQGQEQSRGFYLQGYDGNQGYTVDRIGRGKDLHCERVCLAMLGSIQPGKLQSYVREAVNGGSGDDGLLQRFGLAVWPDNSLPIPRIDQYPDEDARAMAFEVFSRLSNLSNVQQVKRFTTEAQEIYWDWIETLERELQSEDLHPAFVSHLAKYRKLIPALALIFNLVDRPESDEVGKEELLRSLAWGEYLRSHAGRIYRAATVPEVTGAKNLLSKIQTGKLSDRDGVLLDRFTPREVANKNWTGLDSTKSVTKATELLVEYGYLRGETVQSSDPLNRGRPSYRYLVNPALLRGSL